jgi:flagellar basal-body rod protein FlgC
MGIFSSMDISAGGLQAQRLRMDVIAENIANAEATRTPEGGPYRRREVILQTSDAGLARAGTSVQEATSGVEVAGIEVDPSPLQMVYDPSHPDADAQGYVAMPNVNIPTEMADMLTATRAYEANTAAYRASRDMNRAALDLMK